MRQCCTMQISFYIQYDQITIGTISSFPVSMENVYPVEVSIRRQLTACLLLLNRLNSHNLKYYLFSLYVKDKLREILYC